MMRLLSFFLLVTLVVERPCSILSYSCCFSLSARNHEELLEIFFGQSFDLLIMIMIAFKMDEYSW